MDKSVLQSVLPIRKPKTVLSTKNNSQQACEVVRLTEEEFKIHRLNICVSVVIGCFLLTIKIRMLTASLLLVDICSSSFKTPASMASAMFLLPVALHGMAMSPSFPRAKDDFLQYSPNAGVCEQ